MHGLPLAIASATLLVAAPAAANTAEPELLEEAPVAVRATLDGTTARMFVDYQVTSSDKSVSTQVELPLPIGAVVAGATITHAGTRHRMVLDTADNVEKRFAAAFENEDRDAKPRAYVAKIDANMFGLGGPGVALFVGAPPETRLEVTLEVTAPTCLFRDLRYVLLPETWQGAVRARPPSAELVEACAGKREADFTWKAFPAPEAARMPSGDRVHATTARLAIDNDLHLARTELALAANLADVPRDLATVLLVDESRSMSAHQRKAQREIVLGYLRAAPNSRVQVIAFSRRTRLVTPGWMVAARALARVERELASMTPRNGSSFDLGLADAGRALSAIEGTRRVLLVTDEALSSRLATTPEKLAALVPAGTIINVAVTDGENGDEVLARHDGARLVRLAAVTTGFATSLGEIDPQQRTPIDATMLVRPMSLDHVRATGLGWSPLDEAPRATLVGSTCEGSLPSGQSCVWWTRGNRAASTIQLEGLMWNRRVVRLVRPLADVNHTIAREIVATNTEIGTGDETDLDEDGSSKLGKRIDALARAVTPTTSLFARWGAPERFPDEAAFIGRGGFGRSGTIGHSHDVGIRRTGRLGPADLATQLRPLVASCGLGTAGAEIKLELTFEEIVEVDVTIGATGAHAASVRACIEDAVWDFTPSLPSLDPLRTETVVL